MKTTNLFLEVTSETSLVGDFEAEGGIGGCEMTVEELKVQYGEEYPAAVLSAEEQAAAWTDALGE